MAKKRFFTALIAVVLATLLAGCSTAAPQMNSGQAEATMAPAAPAADSAGKDQADGSAMPVIDPGNTAASGKKIIYTVDMTIEAANAAAAINTITEATAELGGYVADSRYVKGSREASSYITVRIPPEKLGELSKLVGTLGEILSQNMSSQDVTSQYNDIRISLDHAKAQETQLLELMKKAVTIDDILKMRKELNGVELEIEQYEGQIRLMDNQVGYSTLKISIQEPEPPAVVVEDKPDKGVEFWGFPAVGQKISRGFSDSFNWTLNALSGVLMVLSYISVPLVLIAIVVLAIILLVRVLSKRGKQAKQAK